MEAQEKEDILAGFTGKAVKGKVGKPKMKKLQLEETLPSMYGRRIEPQISAMKADVSKKMLKKKKVSLLLDLTNLHTLNHSKSVQFVSLCCKLLFSRS